MQNHGTDSAALKYTLKPFHFSRSILSLRDLADIKGSTNCIKIQKTILLIQTQDY